MTREPATWRSLGRTLSAARHAPRQNRLFWFDMANLADELAALSPLSLTEARTLVDSTYSDLPVILTFRHPIGDAVKVVAMVDQIMAPAEDPALRESVPGHIYIRYTGFSHSVYLTDVLDITTPSMEYPEETQ